MSAPLTLGTAGHVDHGKTALVGALTGVDTDRLAEERARGISIVLGYARLELPSGRALSVVDVPGHERFVRTMVAGATGIDRFLLTVAADDGVMPQTREHWTVLQALGVPAGVVAITKADVADPARAAAEARELVGDGPAIVACSARTGAGLDELRAALDALAPRERPRDADRPAVLHVDRAFTIKGAGTVVTGTLWTGTLSTGDHVRLLPEGDAARIRGLQVHDAPVDRAAAGQRVAVNLTGLDRARAEAAKALVALDADVAPAHILEADLALGAPPADGRVTVHHGTVATPARIVALGHGRWQIRARDPLMARAGDRVVVRASSPPDTLGGGTITDPRARRAKPHEAPPPVVAPREPAAEPLSAAALTLEQELRAAGHEPPNEQDLDPHALKELRAHGRAVRVGRAMYAHPDAVAAVAQRVADLVERDGAVTLASLRDDLRTSRKFAQALLEHLDATRVTRRLPDDRRVLRRRA